MFIRSSLASTIILLVSCLGPVSTGHAQAAVQREGVLSALPGKPGPHLEKSRRLRTAHGSTWARPRLIPSGARRAAGAPCHGSNSYSTHTAVMEYDPVSDAVLLFRYGGEVEAERGIFSYDPNSNAWSEVTPGFSEPWKEVANAFYDPVLNAHFFHVAGDSNDNGIVWVYRHRAK